MACFCDIPVKVLRVEINRAFGDQPMKFPNKVKWGDTARIFFIDIPLATTGRESPHGKCVISIPVGPLTKLYKPRPLSRMCKSIMTSQLP